MTLPQAKPSHPSNCLIGSLQISCGPAMCGSLRSSTVVVAHQARDNDVEVVQITQALRTR